VAFGTEDWAGFGARHSKKPKAEEAMFSDIRVNANGIGSTGRSVRGLKNNAKSGSKSDRECHSSVTHKLFSGTARHNLSGDRGAHIITAG
jgi:hypothetical protein